MDDDPPPPPFSKYPNRNEDGDEDILQIAHKAVARYRDQRDIILRENEMTRNLANVRQQITCSVEFVDKNLAVLPEELVDILKDDLERIALNRNRLTGLSGLGPRFSEFKRLKYLNIRENKLEIFPPEILTVPTLEVLDVRDNRIKYLPKNLDSLPLLRVLEFRRNKVVAIPQCLANMHKLTRVGHRKNKITWPPLAEWIMAGDKPKIHDEELLREEQETKLLLKVLQKYAKQQLGGIDVGKSDGPVETPKQAKRAPSGRFPIKPSIDLSSLPNPPSPFVSKQSSISKSSSRAGNIPLSAVRANMEPTLLNERNRSNSESQMSIANRSKRMGLQFQDPNKVDFLSESKLNRLSHNRGLSHGSALTNGIAMRDPKQSVVESRENYKDRHMFGTRLSSLPEDRRKSKHHVPSIELAHSVLYSVEQLQDSIKHISIVVKDANSSKSNLERNRVQAFSFVDFLSKQLFELETISEEAEDGGRRRSISSVPGTTTTCIHLFANLVREMRNKSTVIAERANPRYTRTLLHLLHASTIELRNACSKVVTARQPASSAPLKAIEPAPADAQRPTTSLRVKQSPPRAPGFRMRARRPGSGNNHLPHKPSGLSGSTSSTNSQLSAFGHGREVGGQAFVPSPVMSRSNTMTSVDEGEEHQFEGIFKAVQSACNSALDALPRIHNILSDRMRSALDDSHFQLSDKYAHACDLAKAEIDKASRLRDRMSAMKLKEKRYREQTEFWQTCAAFTNAHMNFVTRLQDMERARLGLHEIKQLLRPVQRYVKDANNKIRASPWQSLAGSSSSQNPFPPATPHPVHLQQPTLSLQTRLAMPTNPYSNDPWSAASSQSMGSQGYLSSGYATPASGTINRSMPATPFNATMGPAAQATQPPMSGTMPQQQSYFPSGNWPERQKSFSRR